MQTHSGTILVVDDQDSIRDLLTRHLEMRGHTTIAAAGGREALEQLRTHNIDLVLLDLMMPGINGIQVLERVKQSRALRHIPVLVISADTEMAQVVRCIELGAEDYLGKPINTVLLNARVQALLERKQLRDREQAYLEQRLRGLSSGTAGSLVPGGEGVDTRLRAALDQLEQAQQARREAEAELLTLNLTLEQRVAERTEELARARELLQRQTDVLESVLRSIGDGVIVADQNGRIMLQNPAAQRLLGNQAGMLLAEGAASPGSTEPGAAPANQGPLTRAIRGEVVDGAEIVLHLPEGAGTRWLHITAHPLVHFGALAGGVAVVHDITTAKQTELALRASEQRYVLAAHGANDGLWDWDLVTNQIYYSPRWKAMLGYAEDEIGTSPSEWLSRVDHDDRERLEVRLTAHWQQLLSPFEYEYRIRHRDGTVRWMLCRGLAIWDGSGRATRMAGSQTDITERKAAEQRLQHDALHDALTALPNRLLFTDRLSQALARAHRDPAQQFAVLFLDLDRFKVINDSMGHLTGDQLLVSMGERLRASVRASDTVARLGGDEFTVLIEPLAERSEVSMIATRILDALRAPFILNGQDVYTSASIGIAVSTPDHQRPGDLLRDADIAMYHAKLHGKARYALFEPHMRDQALNSMQLETDLRHAIERNELRVHYQPIVALADQAMIGFEALVRWNHPQRGLIPPGQFIPIAEETGQIIAIGRWVLHEACRQLRDWQTRYPHMRDLIISVNVASQQLTRRELVDEIIHVLTVTGLAPGCLKLEITETALIEHRDIAAATLNELHAMGIAICIDDFGTGYSSLGYLHQFPIDVLKIDKTFISRLGTSSDRKEIVQTIIALAQSLGIATVAEGVETAEQHARLQALQCPYGQGWLFARALEPGAAEALLAVEAAARG